VRADANRSQIVVLEAMKLEIAVKMPEAAHGKGKMKIDNVLVKPGGTVTAGAHLALLRLSREHGGGETAQADTEY